MPIKYRRIKNGKYYYELTADVIIETGICPPEAIVTRWISLSKQGTLWIIAGYQWDGMTCWRDTQESMLPSVVHDAFCQLIRTEQLAWTPYRRLADELLYELCVTSVVAPLECDLIYCGVRLYADVKGMFK